MAEEESAAKRQKVSDKPEDAARFPGLTAAQAAADERATLSAPSVDASALAAAAQAAGGGSERVATGAGEEAYSVPVPQSAPQDTSGAVPLEQHAGPGGGADAGPPGFEAPASQEPPAGSHGGSGDPEGQGPPPQQEGSAHDECHRYLTPEGCPFGDKCRYRHGAADTRELQSSADPKSKACTKFFSTSGCPYGEGCHFNHYVPGGIAALGISASRPVPSPLHAGSFAGKPNNNICRRLSQPGGCRFGDKCHFLHPGETTLAGPGPPVQNSYMEGGGYGGPYGGGGGYGPPREGAYPGGPEGPGGYPGEPLSPGRGHRGAMGGMPPPSFGATTNAKISVDANLVGAIIGKAGGNVKYIVKQSGAKVSIREHDSDPTQKTVDMEGSLEQIEYATRLVRQFLAEKVAAMQANQMGPPGSRGGRLGSHNYKTRMCDNFMKGACNFGPRCHFAHGHQELREAQAAAGGPPAPGGM